MSQRGGRGFSDNRGRSPRPAGGRPPQFRAPAGADVNHVDDSLGSTDGMYRGGRTNPQQRSRGGVSRPFEPKLVYRPKQPAFSGSPGFSNVVRQQSSSSPTGSVSRPVPKDIHLGATEFQNIDIKVTPQQDESRSHSKSGAVVEDSLNKGPNNTKDIGDSGHSEDAERSRGGVSRHFEPKLVYRPKWLAFSGSPGFSNVVRQQSSSSPTGSVSKPSESADSILPSGDAQSVPKDVHLGASDLQNGDKPDYSAFSEKVKVNVMAHQDESKLHSKSGAGFGDSLNKGTKSSEENGDSGHSEQGGRTSPHHRPQGSLSKHFEPKPSSGKMYRQKQPASCGDAGFSNVVRHQSSAGISKPSKSADSILARGDGVSKPSESADSILARGDGVTVLSAQSVPKDVRLGATELQNGDESGYSASRQDESRLHSKSGVGLGDFLNKGTGNSAENGDSGHFEQGGTTNPHHRPQGGVSKHFELKSSSGNMYRQKQPTFRGGTGFSSVVRHQQGQSSANPRSSVSKPSEPVASNLAHEGDLSVSPSRPVPKDIHLGATEFQNIDIKVTPQQDESRSHSKSGDVVEDSLNKGPNNTKDIGDSGHSEDAEEIKRFDICPSKSGAFVKLKPSLLEKNKEKRRSLESHGSILRSGMVLLKNFLSLNDQVKIVKQCRDLGIGSGGFYQPGYVDGKELHLKMMCLGKNWDPETSKYGDIRPHDSTTPPKIPGSFNQFVLKAIEDSHTLIRKDSKLINVQNVLPSMSPNICIINFYTSSGRLGLHQDKDETNESLCKGLPVVSFSIGDSAEFLYGDERDVDKAKKVRLDSGDLLIFGGKARHIFHGVTSILPNTAPKALLQETNLQPGRLNLTFREY